MPIYSEHRNISYLYETETGNETPIMTLLGPVSVERGREFTPSFVEPGEGAILVMGESGWEFEYPFLGDTPQEVPETITPSTSPESYLSRFLRILGRE
jgi:hypothetical protein